MKAKSSAKNPAVAPIPRQTLTAAVANALREKIIRGEIEAGEQLRQHAIASEFAVSRIPVREALRQLEAEGLIEIIDHRGAVVSALSPAEIVELFEIRAVLESHVLRYAIPKLRKEDLESAEEILNQYDRLLDEEADVSAWGDLNWQFHSTLYERSDRPQFLSLIKTLHNNSDRFIRMQLWLTHEIRRAEEEHRRILDLCVKQQVDLACALMHDHIVEAGRSLARYLKQHRNESE